MSDSKPARPPQVTLAGWLVVGGSVLVVVFAFARVTQLGSIESQDAIEESLANLPGGTGLTVADGQSILRVCLMIAAATAAACAILGWQVLQRSKGARIALSALALPLFVTGLASGGYASAIVTAAVVMLWFQPARDWFDGRTRPTPAPVRAPAPPSVGRPSAPPPVAPGWPPPPGPFGPRPVVAERPSAVVWACIITWVCTLSTALLFALVLVQITATPDQLLDQLRRQEPYSDFSETELTRLVVTFSVVALVWSLAAALLAVLVWRRKAWAAVTLGVLAALACVTLLPIVACVATGVLLLRAESRAWFAGPHPSGRGPLGP